MGPGSSTVQAIIMPTLPSVSVDASSRWSAALAGWAIPSHILAAAPVPPWGFPVEVFAQAARRALASPLSPTHRHIAEVLPEGGTLLDVGAGAGAASLPVAAAAGRLVAVDQDRSMLDALAEIAREAGLRPVLEPEEGASEGAAGAKGAADDEGAAGGEGAGNTGTKAGLRLDLVTGRWPDVAGEVGRADVAVAANVAYNVAELGAFVEHLYAAAPRRVVLELTSLHPTAPLSPLWERFWGLRRPDGPRAEDAAAVVEEACGTRVGLERWQRDDWVLGAGGPRWVRRRLCLPAEREPEVAEALAELPSVPTEMVTIWWPEA